MSVVQERDTGALPLVSRRVQQLLASSAAYQELPEAKQRELAADMVNVAQFIVAGQSGDSIPRAATLAGAPVARLSPQFRGANATAAQQGAGAYTSMIRDVNFPAFVAGLIDGVFNAIVTSSIKQMEAYADLVKNVSKSVDDFMKDNISENSARDYLAGRYPDHLEVDTSGQQPVLKPKQGSDDNALPNFFSDLGLTQPVQSLDDETPEQTLVPAARKRMAMDRQQLLATMVLMGINRLVVTDGHIQASCTFELNTTDSLTRHADRATDSDVESTSTSKGSTKENDWYNPITFDSSRTAKFTVSTHRTEDSAEAIDMHAKLGGKVQVNFKSDYFPLEKIADVLQVNEIQQKAPQGMQNQQRGVPGAPALAGSALPSSAPPAPPPVPAAAP